MKKKYIILLICSVVAVAACVVLILYKSNAFSNKIEFSEKMFATQDSAKVTKVFIADMNGNSVLLQRNEKNGWQLDDGTAIVPEMISSLLSTMMNMRVSQTVQQTQIENITRVIAVSGIKVEVYENQPKFTLFKHPFFVKERKVKTYYLGPATQDNMGNYAILEGMEEKPCIIHLPGFRGFVSPRFSALRTDWISHQLLSTKPTRIQSLVVRDCENEAESFSIQKVDELHYDLFDANQNKIPVYDTTRLLNLLAEFRDKKFESISQISSEEKDKVLKNNLFKSITLTDINGKTVKLDCYHMDSEYDYYDNESGDKLTDIEYLYNRDRFYATLNGDPSTLYCLQYFGFDRIVQPLSYLLERYQPKTEISNK